MVPCSGSRVNTRFLGYSAAVRGRVLLCVIALFGRRKKKTRGSARKKTRTETEARTRTRNAVRCIVILLFQYVGVPTNENKINVTMSSSTVSTVIIVRMHYDFPRVRECAVCKITCVRSYHWKICENWQIPYLYTNSKWSIVQSDREKYLSEIFSVNIKVTIILRKTSSSHNNVFEIPICLQILKQFNIRIKNMELVNIFYFL